MKIDIDGIVRKMTEQEEAEYREQFNEDDPISIINKLAERIDALQSMSTAVTQRSELDAAYREGGNSI